MKEPNPVFIADSCIGGLSVLKSLWSAGCASDAIFLADYEINPLGVKTDAAIAEVVSRWLTMAAQHADTLIMACNTLSVRYRELLQSNVALPKLDHVISMVDCFDAMVEAETDRLANKNVLVIGTQYTASQDVYPDILNAAVPGVRADTVAATELERHIARFQPWDSDDNSVLTSELRQAIENTDIAVLACTCFPMAAVKLESLFPDVFFLDPGLYCARLLNESAVGQNQALRFSTTGNVVAATQAVEFARSYLGRGRVFSL